MAVTDPVCTLIIWMVGWVVACNECMKAMVIYTLSTLLVASLHTWYWDIATFCDTKVVCGALTIGLLNSS